MGIGYELEPISTHAPLAGRDVSTLGVVTSFIAFQPTRPLRGATTCHGRSRRTNIEFQPTRPLRGATRRRRRCTLAKKISTHAPLAGRDQSIRYPKSSHENFNPRAPCGARLRELYELSRTVIDFNPRAPCGARPKWSGLRFFSSSNISTHAPLAGRDSKSVQIALHIFAITDKFQMLLHRMPPVRAFCSFLMQENHADFGCEPPK